MANRFEKQGVVITGGSHGIGLGLVKRFLSEGALVFVLDIAPIHLAHANLQYIACDVSDFNQVQRAFQKIQLEAKRIDVLVADAGVHLLKAVEETTPAELKRLFEVNVFGAFYCAQAALEMMEKQQYGRIVLMGSDQGVVGRSLGTAYGMSKAAVIQLAKSLSADVAEKGILINSICPSTVANTGMTDNAARHFSKQWALSESETLEKFAEEHLSKKLITSDEIAHWVLQLCSKDNISMTGAAIVLDGGLTTVRK